MVGYKQYQYQVWLSFIFLSVVMAAFSYKYFDKVAPIVQLSITADRQQVIDSAVVIASDLQWDLSGYHTCVQFACDANLQNFVELEGGGKKAFIDMFQSGIYYPYQWQVRFFKEQEVVEMSVYFTPDGAKIGFHQKVSEQSLGQALSKEKALQLVEKDIASWCSYFENYTLVEYNSEKRDSGRIDHSFIFERTDLAIGKGLYRFKAVVCGDVITTLEPTIKIPDEFTRRYQEMRSANELVARFGVFILYVVYLFILALFGLIYFYRHKYLLAKAAFVAALVVAFLELLRDCNDYRLWWTSYNTIQSSSTFMMMKCCGIFIEFLVLLGMIFIGLVVAEAAGRAMYKHHIQFFTSLRWPALSSYQIFEQISLGYLCVPFMFGYEILFTYLTEHYLSWWSPASSMSDPNVIAAYLPWFGPISISIRAGFSEEILFRALPLAMTAFLARKSKHKKIWFGLMFIVQAIVFGACHANYPNQPFFTRLVELLVPSFGFGLLYCKFGLIPGALCHFVYDAILFALPIFASSLFWSKLMVIVLIGLPFLLVLSILIYNTRLYDLPAQLYNKAFPDMEYIPVQIEYRRIGTKIPQKNIMILCALAAIGGCLLLVSDHFRSDIGPLQVSKAQAIECAAQAIEEEFGVDVRSDWDVMALVQDDSATTLSRFIWQVYDKDVYQYMQGSYIQGVSWLVRFIQFNRLVEDRAEEFKVRVSNNCRCSDIEPDDTNPKILALSHVLPEHYQGDDISEKQALIIAYAYVHELFGLAEKEVSLVSVASNKLENRRDWTIVLQDLEFFDFSQDGQARIELTISGDVVTKYSRYIFVPEDWARADTAFLMNISIFKITLYFLLMLFILMGCMFGLKKLLVSYYGIKIIRHKALFITALVGVVSINNFCIYVGSFNSAEPFYDQCGRIALQLVFSSIWQIFFCSVFLTIAAVGFIKSHKQNYLKAFGISIAIALFLIGICVYVNQFDILLQPKSGIFACAAGLFPVISLCGSKIAQYCLMLSMLVSVFLVVKSLFTQWKYKMLMELASFMLFCCALQAFGTSQSIEFMMANGLLMGSVMAIMYWLILQFDMTLLPLIIAVVFAMSMASELIYPSYVGSQFDAVIAMIMMIAVGLFFYERSHVE